MPTLRTAAALLRAGGSTDGLTRIARSIGFCGSCTALDSEARQALSIPQQLHDVSIIQGPGSLRALVFTVDTATDLRDAFGRLSARLSARAPHVLWMFVAAERAGDAIGLGAPIPGRRPARVAAAIARRTHVMDSDADTLRLLAAAASDDDLAAHARFIEVLGRDALSRRFFRTLEQCVDNLAASATAGSAPARREVALLYTSRLLFLGFLEAKGWLDDDAAFLTRTFDACMASGGSFHSRVMLPLFFGTLNTPVHRRAQRAREFGRVPFLNGGLFTPTMIERQHKALRFDDASLGRFFGELFSRYRFTAREETSSFEEAAIDPEMLGRTFECLMAAESRRTAGAFYTPHELVARVTTCGLEEALGVRVGTALTDCLLRGELPGDEDAAPIRRALSGIQVLDPACGSGAFLVHTLDRLAALHAVAGDDRSPEAVRRHVLARSIFGVDVDPTAVWLCQLRLWLSIVIDARASTRGVVAPLPNLDRNIRVGDSLTGIAFDEVGSRGASALRTLRERYTRASGRRKASLARLLDREERRLVVDTTTQELSRVSAARRDIVAARRGRDLFGGRYAAARDELKQAATLRRRSADLRRRLQLVQRGESMPFAFPAHFADVAAAGGFSLIVGNPPWVRPHRLDARLRENFRERYVVARSAPWISGAEAAGAGRGFSGQVDLAALFVERSLRLLAPAGAMALLLPSKLWRSLAGGGLRDLLVRETSLRRVEDYSDVPASFDAAVYPGLLVAARLAPGDTPEGQRARCTQVTVLHRARMPSSWSSRQASIAWDESTGAPWILAPAEVRRSFELVRQAGTPLAATRFGRPLLGVKCGLNDAFVVEARPSGDQMCRIVAANGREGLVEVGFLRPIARGERVRRWAAPTAGEQIIWTHDASGSPVPRLPDGVSRWLSPYRRALMARTDARSSARWWSLFRTEAAGDGTARVIWADIGRELRAAVLDAGDCTVPLNSCYVVRSPTDDDALALASLLNSQLASAWLSIVAEPARGGYRRYLGWTMSLFPVPADWQLHRGALSDLARRARLDPDAVSESDLLDAAISAFGLSRRDVDPLLAWAAR